MIKMRKCGDCIHFNRRYFIPVKGNFVETTDLDMATYHETFCDVDGGKASDGSKCRHKDKFERRK